MNSINQAMLLCGGLGTRLRGLFPDLPKALVPVNGRPFISYMIEGLQRQGVNTIHIAAGYRAGQIKEWAEKIELPGLTITVSVEPAQLGTAGGIKYALPFVATNGPILVLNGDSLLPKARINELALAKRSTPIFKAVIASVEMTERGQYGTVEMDQSNRITAFREKADNVRGYVNGGIYYLDPDIFNDISSGEPVSIEKEVFPGLASTGQLGAVKVDGPLLDMGTPSGLEKMADYFSSPQ